MSAGEVGVQGRARVLNKGQIAICSKRDKKCSDPKRKDPIGYKSVILIVATHHRSTVLNGYNMRIYRKMIAQNRTANVFAGLSHGYFHHYAAESL